MPSSSTIDGPDDADWQMHHECRGNRRSGRSAWSRDVVGSVRHPAGVEPVAHLTRPSGSTSMRPRSEPLQDLTYRFAQALVAGVLERSLTDSSHRMSP